MRKLATAVKRLLSRSGGVNRCARRAGSGLRRNRLLVSALLVGALPLGSSVASELSPGDLAPNFTLKSTTGENLRRGEQAGNVMVLLFTASWCGTCTDALRQLQSLNQQFKPYGFHAWGIDLDSDPAKIRQSAQQLGLNYPLLMDTEGSVAKLFWIDDLPALFILDRDGRIRQVLEGEAVTNTARIADAIKAVAEE